MTNWRYQREIADNRLHEIYRQIADITRELDYIDMMSPKFSVKPSDREYRLMAERRELRSEMRKLLDAD